jgi:hypothetical protein
MLNKGKFLSFVIFWEDGKESGYRALPVDKLFRTVQVSRVPSYYKRLIYEMPILDRKIIKRNLKLPGLFQTFLGRFLRWFLSLFQYNTVSQKHMGFTILLLLCKTVLKLWY